jgi:methionyl-tRNA formyltransferase
VSGPRLLVFAYSDVGHACLKFLLDRKENVVAVYTHEDKPGEQIWFPSVSALAREHGLPVRTEERLGADELRFISSLAPDLIFSFYYRNLIPSAVLDLPKLGAYNMHGSLLPRYRGRAPVNWAVLNGEKQTGATLHVMVAKADAGDIVDQQPVDIGPDDTAIEVQARVTQAAVTVLSRQIDNLRNGAAPRRPQDASQATVFGRRRPEDGAIQWTMTAAQIHNLVRAVSHPYPGAFADVLGERTMIWRTRLPADAGTKKGTPPGMALVRGGRLCVACGDGKAIELVTVQRAGGPEMTGAEFVKSHREAKS